MKEFFLCKVLIIYEAICNSWGSVSTVSSLRHILALKPGKLYMKRIFLIQHTVKLHKFQKENRICLVSFNWVSIFWRSQQSNCFIRERKCDDKWVHDLPHSLKIGHENMATAQCSKTNLMFLPTPNYWISGCDVILPDSPYKNGLSRVTKPFSISKP